MLEVHPELRQAANWIPKFSFSRKNLWWLRFLTGLMRGPGTPKWLVIENTFIRGKNAGAQIRLRLYRPKAAPSPAPVLLWMHGGGYLIGQPELDDLRCIRYAQALGLVIVSVDYRLAPEHPFPAPLDDCYSALEWVVAQAHRLAIDPKRLAIGGESAGGGLAAALAQLAHDRKAINPVFQLLVYPMLDDRTVIRTDIVNHGRPLWTQDSNRFGWESYLGKKAGADDVPDYAVPARREDLSGLPPAWIGVGTLDLFHDEDVAYAQRLQAAGVECELNVVPGAFHGFDVFSGKAQVVEDFLRAQVAALAKQLRPVTT